MEDYDIGHPAADLVALVEHVGAQKGVCCGHDWGGFVVWSMARRHPDRTAGVIGVNTPHSDRAPADPIAIMRNRLGGQMYIVAFQPPGEAEQVLHVSSNEARHSSYRTSSLGYSSSKNA